MAVLQPQRVRYFSPAEASQPFQYDRADRGDDPGNEQHEDDPGRRDRLDGVQERARVKGPCEVLERLQQLHQRSTAETGGDADRCHEHPEPDAVAGDDAPSGHVRLGRGEAVAHARAES